MRACIYGVPLVSSHGLRLLRHPQLVEFSCAHRVVPINWFILYIRRSWAFSRFPHWTHFRLLACRGTEEREDRAFDIMQRLNETTVPLIVQISFWELPGTHLNIQSFPSEFYIAQQTKLTSAFLVMTLQMWGFPYHVTLHFSSPSSALTRQMKWLQEPSPISIWSTAKQDSIAGAHKL